MRVPFEHVPPTLLRAVAGAIRAGRLEPVTRMALQRVTQGAPGAAGFVDDALALVAEGLSSAHLVLMLEIAARAAEGTSHQSSCELVWTGPEGRVAQSRDTAVVLADLFGAAERRVTISTFVVRQTALVFGALARRMEERPDLQARIFLHIPRGLRDTRHESELVREFADSLRMEWPGARRPEVFYDPRSVSADREIQATWHAKCVVVDGRVAFVTSANFTEWAQSRNVEAGVLVRDDNFAGQLQAQFDSLVEARAVVRLPGW